MKIIQQIDPEKLLGRAPVDVDMAPAARFIRAKRVLVTGAAGSIGSELAMQIAAFGPSALCLADQAETPLHSLRLRFARLDLPEGLEVTAPVVDVADRRAMTRLFESFLPEVVFHAAAYKHVPMMEDNPHSAVTNNVLSTRILADLAAASPGCGCFVLVSTDKAVNPTNVMGASKRACELYVQSLGSSPAGAATRFITTRFGNVLASQGSVIPLFLSQLAAGGPLTVTHPEVRRFFMLISEACRLVLLAAALGRGAEIFAFDMGRPVRIADLARRIIALAGNGMERIVFTGLRPGEKLYEEVLTSDEVTLPGPHPLIHVARVRPADFATIGSLTDELIATARSDSSTPMQVVAALKRLVPEFRSVNSPYSVLD